MQEDSVLKVSLARWGSDKVLPVTEVKADEQGCAMPSVFQMVHSGVVR